MQKRQWANTDETGSTSIYILLRHRFAIVSASEAGDIRHTHSQYNNRGNEVIQPQMMICGQRTTAFKYDRWWRIRCILCIPHITIYAFITRSDKPIARTNSLKYNREQPYCWVLFYFWICGRPCGEREQWAQGKSLQTLNDHGIGTHILASQVCWSWSWQAPPLLRQFLVCTNTKTKRERAIHPVFTFRF